MTTNFGDDSSHKSARSRVFSINGPLRADPCSAPKAPRTRSVRLLRGIASILDALSEFGRDKARNGAVPTWFVGERKPIDAAPVLDDALERVGYAPCGRMTDPKLSILGYRANGSSADVEQFLVLSVWGQPNHLVSAEGTLRHPPAEAFASEAVLRYLPSAFRELYARMSPWDCGLRFDVGGVARWPDGRIDALEQTPQELGQTLDAAVRQFALAKYQGVYDCASLFDLAFGDEAPFRWRPWGDSRRVAMTIYLGRKLGRDSASLKSTLVSRVEAFNSAPNASAPSAEEFVDRTLTEADAALAQAR